MNVFAINSGKVCSINPSITPNNHLTQACDAVDSLQDRLCIKNSPIGPPLFEESLKSVPVSPFVDSKPPSVKRVRPKKKNPERPGRKPKLKSLTNLINPSPVKSSSFDEIAKDATVSSKRKRERSSKMHMNISNKRSAKEIHNINIEKVQNRKSTKSMEATKQQRLDENVLDRLRRERQDQIFRHARQCARAIRKGDAPPSSLPPTPDALRCHVEPLRSIRPYRICDECQISKSSSQFLSFGTDNEFEAWCLHCLTDTNDAIDENRWCYLGRHNSLRSDCIRNECEYSSCNACENAKESGKQNVDQIPELISVDLQAPAISSNDWKLVGDFYNSLDQLERTTCDICNEIGFDMKIQIWDSQNECGRCRTDRKKHSDMPPLFGATNDMDPGAVPSHLPSLSIAEELLIAWAHVLMDYRRIKGCQYKYSGHVVNFMQNTAKIINRLPSLPSELQILVLKPSSSSIKDSAVHKEFDRTFRVRRQNVEIWLKFLIDSHPDYSGLSIDADRLSQLPDNDTIFHQLSTIEDPENNQETNDIPQDVPGMFLVFQPCPSGN